MKEAYLDNYELQSLLLPGKLESVSVGRNYDGESVLIKFVWGSTTSDALDELVKYIKEHGVLK